MQGIGFQSQWLREDINNAATKKFKQALATVGYTAPNPEQGIVFGYFPTLRAVTVFEHAGKNLTWKSVITAGHKLTHYTATGMIAPVNYSKFGNVTFNSAGTCLLSSGDGSVGRRPVRGPRRVRPQCGAARKEAPAVGVMRVRSGPPDGLHGCSSRGMWSRPHRRPWNETRRRPERREGRCPRSGRRWDGSPLQSYL